MNKQQFLDAVKAAGIVGEGGAGFPSHVKYQAEAEIVIANGCECEPLLHTDQHHMLEGALTLVQTLSLLGDMVGAKRKVIGLKKKYKQAIQILQAAIAQSGCNVELALLDNFYPAGDEQILVREITGRSVPPLGLPLHVGVVVANVGTLLSVAKALQGQAMTHKVLTVTGDVAKPGLISAPLGTPLLDCLAAAGGTRLQNPIFILGGPMMGRVVESLDPEVVTKTSGGIIVLPSGHYLHRNATLAAQTMRRRAAAACIQCRFCSDLCPRNLIGHPFQTHKVMRAFANNAELEVENGKLALLCCDCGVCEHFSCPMGLVPRRINQYIKQELRAQKASYSGSRDLNEDQTNWREVRRVPVPRLIHRLGLSKYQDLVMQPLQALQPAQVRIPLHQHLGAPAIATVKVGDKVQLGDLIGEIPENALGARIHASLSGTITQVNTHIAISQA